MPVAASGTTRSSTLWLCCWGMRSAANARWKHSMSACSRSPMCSWPCSDGIACLFARHSPAFLPPWIKRRSRHCARCFSKTYSPNLWRRRRKRGDSGTGRGRIGSCSMWMELGKPPANELCPAPLISQRHNAAWTRSALLAIRGASAESVSGRAPLFCKPTRTNGSARSPGHLGQATAITGETCGRLRRQSVRIRKPSLFP